MDKTQAMTLALHFMNRHKAAFDIARDKSKGYEKQRWEARAATWKDAAKELTLAADLSWANVLREAYKQGQD